MKNNYLRTASNKTFSQLCRDDLKHIRALPPSSPPSNSVWLQTDGAATYSQLAVQDCTGTRMLIQALFHNHSQARLSLPAQIQMLAYTLPLLASSYLFKCKSIPSARKCQDALHRDSTLEALLLRVYSRTTTCNDSLRRGHRASCNYSNKTP